MARVSTTIEEANNGGRLAFAGLLLLLVWLPLPFGSHRFWAETILELAVCVLWVFWLLSFAVNRARAPRNIGRWALPLLLWLIWIGWIGLQLVPLSVEWVEQSSPLAYQAYSAAYELVGEALPARLPVTVAADVTRGQLLLTAAYFGLYALVLMTATSHRRLRLLASVILLSGVIQALYGGFMVVSGTEYGFFEKKNSYLGYATGTFVNRNHLAGYLEICLAVGIGMLLSSMGGRKAENWRQRARNLLLLFYSDKLRIRIFLAVMVLGLILTKSRMGNAAFFSSLVACGLCYVLLRERRYLGRALLLFVSLILIDTWILGSQVGLDKLAERYSETSTQTEMRVPVFHDLIPMVQAYHLTGSGLGTFFLTYPMFRSPEIAAYVDYAHNDYAQFLIEAGVIGACLPALLALFTVLHALNVMWRRKDRLMCGIAFAGFMSIVSLAIHSTVDFNLQIPANAATLVVVMAMTLACSPHSSRRRRKRAENEDAVPDTGLKVVEGEEVVR